MAWLQREAVTATVRLTVFMLEDLPLGVLNMMIVAFYVTSYDPETMSLDSLRLIFFSLAFNLVLCGAKLSALSRLMEIMDEQAHQRSCLSKLKTASGSYSSDPKKKLEMQPAIGELATADVDAVDAGVHNGSDSGLTTPVEHMPAASPTL
jgi:hypothetical protein